jgi:regulatory protein
LKITAIKAQVKNPDRVSVYVDQKYALSLNYAQVLDLKLRVGLEVNEKQLAEFKKASDFGKAYERALNYVMIRPRSVKELHEYARRKKWPPEDVEAIVSKLIARRYLDDGNFARAWVESRAMGGKTSLRKLRLELKQKGVADDVVAEVLALTGFDEQSALAQVVAKKRRLARYQDDQKLMQYLARQGFGFEEIRGALRGE